MTDVQKILLAMAAGYHDGLIGEEDCDGIAKALNGVPELYHMDALKSFLGVQEVQPEEQPEDYLAVKTYTSDVFSVGDEIADGIGRYVILKKEDSGFWVTGTGTTVYVHESNFTYKRTGRNFYKRTGRNFPAIAAIMEELKKA